MAIVNRIQPGVGKCDNCKVEPIRVLGWSITENSGMGYQGLGTVRICPDCLINHGNELKAIPLMMEEMKAVLRDREVPYPAKATHAELVAIYTSALTGDPIPDGALTGDPPPAPPPQGNKIGEPPMLAFLMRKTLAELRTMANEPPYGIAAIPDDVTKQQLATRIIQEHEELLNQQQGGR